jgi:acyl-coenzyme A thioesterase PaaI-like protein
VLHRGRNITTSEGRITDAKGKLYAHASCTCMMVPIG